MRSHDITELVDFAQQPDGSVSIEPKRFGYDPAPLRDARTVKTRYRYVGPLPARELPPDDGSDQPS